jgi:hypothetical protein
MKLSRKHPQPSNGWHCAVLADIEDLGMQDSAFGEKHTLRLTFLVDEKDPNGELFRVTDLCSASPHVDSKLTRYARVLLGCDPGDELETEELLRRCCRLETEVKANLKGKGYPRIIASAPLQPEESGPAIPLNFQRAGNRPPRTTGLSSAQRGTPEARPN